MGRMWARAPLAPDGNDESRSGSPRGPWGSRVDGLVAVGAAGVVALVLTAGHPHVFGSDWHPWFVLLVGCGLIGLGIALSVQRRRDEEKLRDREGLIRSISDNVPTAMLYQILRERDGRRRFTYVSDGVRLLHGCSPEEALADPARIYGQVAEEDRARVREEEENAHRTMSVFRTEARIKGQDGNVRWSFFASSPRSVDDGATRWDGIEIDISTRKQAEEQLNALSLRLLAVQEEERQRLARDLHDEFGQLLAVSKFEAHDLSARLPEDRRDLRDIAGRLIGDIQRAIDTMRSIHRGLYPAILDDLGLNDAIETLVAELRERTGISCSLAISPERFELDPDRQRAIYRIVQEALTNAVRHSGASSVEISLHREGRHLQVRVRDNGSGITPASLSASRSFGLTGMRKRAELCGGRLEIQPHPDRGTVVALEVPLAEGD